MDERSIKKLQTVTAIVLALSVVVNLVWLGVTLVRIYGAEPHTSSSNTIANAQARGQEANSVSERGSELGLNCIGDTEECAIMIARAQRNPALKLAFLKTKAADVDIMPETSLQLGDSAGKVGNGYVTINIDASDEDIIAFLTN